MIGSTVVSALAERRAGQVADATGKANQQAADYQAAQMKVNAGQERAAAQRKALAETKRKDLAQSRVQALSAAGGGGTLDPSIVDIMGDLESEGTLNAQNALYEGEERARDLETGASLKTYEGQQARAAGKTAKKSSSIAVAGALFQGGAKVAGSSQFQSLMDKYG